MSGRWGIIGVVFVLAACGGASARSGTSGVAAAGRTCGPAGATTLAASHLARVYAFHGAVYGCSVGGRRSYRLGSAKLSRPGTARVGPVAVAGEIAAYALTESGVDTASTQVVVTALNDGKRLKSTSSTTMPLGPEAFQSVQSLVVKTDGAVAWIGEASTVFKPRVGDIEVHAMAGTHDRLLDSGASIASGSLRLHGSKLTWKHAGRTRSAKLA